MRIVPKFKFKVSKGPPEMRGFNKASGSAKSFFRRLTPAFNFRLPGRTSRGPNTTYGGPRTVEYPTEPAPRTPPGLPGGSNKRGRKPGSKNKPKPSELPDKPKDMGKTWPERARDAYNDPLTQAILQELGKIARRKLEREVAKRKRQGNYKVTTEGNDSDKATFSRCKRGRYRRLSYGEFKLNEKLVTSKRVVSALGKQYVTEYDVLTRDEISTAASSWLPSIMASSSSSGTSVPYGIDRSAGFYVRSIKLKMQIASSSNVLNTLKIQAFLPKQDLSQNAYTCFQQNINLDSEGTQPTNYSMAAISTIGTSTSRYPGFLRLWRNIFTKTVSLSPGEIHTHYFTFHVNKLLTKSEYEGVLRPGSYLSYTTPVYMLTLSGSIVHDKSLIGTTEGTTDNDSINISQAAIDMIMTREVKFSYKPNAKFNIVRDRTDSVFVAGQTATVDEDGTETTAIV